MTSESVSNLAVIMEQLLQVKDMSNETEVKNALDGVVRMILDMLKQAPQDNYQSLPPINIPPMPMQVSPYGGFEITCVDTANSISDKARELAEKLLGGGR